jgi:hypothetical protein
MPDFASRLRLLQATSDKPGGYAGPAGVDGAEGVADEREFVPPGGCIFSCGEAQGT